MTKSINRKVYLDILRIFATFGVIELHLSATAFYSGQTDYNWFVSIILNGMVRWSVPIFVMISGSLFLNPEKIVTTKKLTHHYVPRLIYAYFFWWISYSLFRISYESFLNEGLVFSIKFLTPHFHLWFLPMLAIVYLFIPFFKLIVQSRNMMIYYLTIWISFISGCCFIPENIPQISKIFTMNMVVGYLGYFLLGYYLSIYNFSPLKRKIVYLLGIGGFLVVVVGTLILNFGGGINKFFINNLSPWVVVQASALFVFIKYNFNKIPHRATSVIEYVRKDLFGIYLLHGFFLILLNTPHVRNLINLLVFIPLCTVLIFLLSLYSSKFLRQIPIIKKVTE